MYRDLKSTAPLNLGILVGLSIVFLLRSHATAQVIPELPIGPLNQWFFSRLHLPPLLGIAFGQLSGLLLSTTIKIRYGEDINAAARWAFLWHVFYAAVFTVLLLFVDVWLIYPFFSIYGTPLTTAISILWDWRPVVLMVAGLLCMYVSGILYFKFWGSKQPMRYALWPKR